tara:strand:+ start:202 stop:537 length:336 start_codon:yes stop_codon:yes gene_type:complete
MNNYSLSMTETEMKEECLICMDCSEDDDCDIDITLSNVREIQHLVKECNCEYRVHEKCLNEWLSKAPMCPICKECMYYDYPKLITKKDENTAGKCLYRFFCCVTSPRSRDN